MVSDKKILKNARKYLNCPFVDSNETSPEITEKIKEITENSIKECENLYSACKRIKDSVEKEFIGFWYCNARYYDIGVNYNTFDRSFLVNLKFGKLVITVGKNCDRVSIPRLLISNFF
jgi:hypothetical protein